MATAQYNKPPPALSSCKSYTDWKKLINIWKGLSGFEAASLGPALVLSLEGEAQEAALEVSADDLAKNTGVESVLAKLDKIYAKDVLSEKYNALEAFETYKRPSSLAVRKFLVEFEKRYSKVKAITSEMPDDLLAFRLLKSANLDSTHEQLIKATVPELKYDDIKNQLTKIFPGESDTLNSDFSRMDIKSGDTLHISQTKDESDGDETYFTNSRRFQSGRNSYSPGRNRNHSPGRSRNHSPGRFGPNSNNWRENNTRPSNERTDRNEDRQRASSVKFGKNPTDRSGKVTRCDICDSINHWATNCPDRETRDQDTLLVHEIVLHQSDLKNPENLKQLTADSWSSGLLDSGASRTVCGKKWYEEYCNSLSEDDLRKVKCYSSTNAYRFGDGEKVESHTLVKIPAFVGDKQVFILTDIINKDIPLLLSKSFMKKSNMILDFNNDTAQAMGQTIRLNSTSSGHYTIPLTKPSQILQSMDMKSTNITLSMRQEKSDHEIALKLHRQFAHPCKNKLINLLDRAGEPWKTNANLKKEIELVSSNCETCIKYKKPSPRPVVGLPMASTFLETVSMDLKFFRGKIILHLIDLCTRQSAAAIVPNKQPETIVKAILKIWISVYGATEKFLVDNGGEFANESYMKMAEQFGITIQTTAAESPWSNGIVERHNRTIAEMLEKVLNDTPCDIETALAWCINAKNSLASVHGFSPYQLSIGTNPCLPNVLNDKAPALTATPSSKVVAENLQAMHKAREAFVQSENSERIRRALRHNIRPSGDIKYVSGDSVYYKRNDASEWHGPGKVLGQDGQQVLVKHGSYYVRVHPCRLRLIHQEPTKNATITRDANSNLDGNKINNNNDDYVVAAPTPTHDGSSLNPNGSTEGNDNLLGNTQPELPSQQGNSNNPTVSAEEHNLPNSTQTDVPIENRGNAMDPSLLKQGMNIRYTNRDGINVMARIDSRAGKANGKYPHWWNTTEYDGTQKAVDFSEMENIQVNDPKESSSEEEDEINVINQILFNNAKDDIKKARLAELEQWKARNVYTEEELADQDWLSLRWVDSPKMIDGKPSVKSRLCVRGFEEEDQNFRTDSPTCSREGLRLALTLIASKGWKLNSLDVKTAFLQGKPIERDVYVKPPKEVNTNKIWKLNKTVYGLADASRSWYLKLKEELNTLGGKLSQLDPGIFTWYRDEHVSGIVLLFVDDVLWGGTSEFCNIIKQLKEIFHIGAENSQQFDYIGVNLNQNEDRSITISQDAYTNNLQPIMLDKDMIKNKSEKLDEKHVTELRGALGKLNWLAGMSRPEISFDVSEISSRVLTSTVADILAVNKVIKFAKSNPGYIKIPRIDLETAKIVAYTDASFGNLPDGGSQGGQAIFMCDSDKNASLLNWSSNRVKRTARNNLASETLAFNDGSDSAFYIAKLIEETLKIKMPVHILTDSQSLFEHIGTTKLASDKRMRVEISAIREMVEKGEISAHWIEKESNVSDVLTKKNASHILMMDTIQEGKLHLSDAF